ncbi:MAG TPA: DUF4142 domain-containing protein [Opitutaceae bacterium]|nr:DUF4142 domain-containing protein [Opitutaceae bacterium]
MKHTRLPRFAPGAVVALALLAVGPVIGATKQPAAKAPARPQPGATANPAPVKPAAAAPGKRAATAPVNLDRRDRRFVEAAAEDGSTDVALATLATDRANDGRVRALADQIGLDRTSLSLEAASLAEATNQPLQNDLPGNRLYRRLAGDGGSHFDHAFVDTMIRRTRNQIDQFAHEAHATPDPQIRDFANRAVTVLRRDLGAAQQLRTVRE